MLRLKQALTDCGIQQKALITATGFGKSQISQTLSSGQLPANADKFKNGVYHLIAEENGLSEWLLNNGLQSHQLFDNLSQPAVAAEPPAYPPDFDQSLIFLTGKNILGGLDRVDVIQLCRAANFLADAVRYHSGLRASDILRGAAEILAGTPS